VLFATVLGTWLLKEKFGLQRALGTAVVVLGVMARLAAGARGAAPQTRRARPARLAHPAAPKAFAERVAEGDREWGVESAEVGRAGARAGERKAREAHADSRDEASKPEALG
jgi:hypothetical protein